MSVRISDYYNNLFEESSCAYIGVDLDLQQPNEAYDENCRWQVLFWCSETASKVTHLMSLSDVLKRLKPNIPRLATASVVVGFAFSAMLETGARLDATLEFGPIDEMRWDIVLAKGVVLSLVCFLVMSTAFAIGHTGTHGEPEGSKAFPVNDSAAQRTKKVRRCTIALAVAWAGWFAILFPGVFAYDGGAWYEMWESPEFKLTTQWSLFYSFAYHGFLSLSKSIAGTYVPGFSLFIILQSIVVLLSAREVFRYLAELNLGYVALGLATLFYALTPPLAILVFSSATDTPFMAFFALVLVNTLRAIDNPSAYWSRPRSWAWLPLAILLLCMSRNNGLFAMALFIPLAAIMYHKQYRRQLALACVTPLVAYMLLQEGFAFATGAITPPFIREAGNVPMFQLARVYNLYNDELSREDKRLLEETFTPEGLYYATYNPSISDVLKRGIDDTYDFVSANLLPLAHLYLYLGKAYPAAYTDAFLLGNLGLWYPLKHYPDPRMYHPYTEPECSVVGYLLEPGDAIPDLSLVPQADTALRYYYDKETQAFSEQPILALVSKSGAYFFLLVFVTVYSIAINRRKYVCALALPWALLVTVALGPVVLFRYVAPLLFSTPLTLTMLHECRSRPEIRGVHARSNNPLPAAKASS